MSCCDGTTVKISNTSGVTMNITAVQKTQGTLRSISPGDQVAAGDTLQGQAYSASGTKGVASGKIGILMEDDPNVLWLEYSFRPDNTLGNCPCYASANSPSDNQYNASGSTQNGSKEGQAWVEWMITSR